MFTRPSSRYRRTISTTSDLLCPTQVRCGMGVIEVSLAMWTTIWRVLSRVDPPAP